MPTAFRAVPLPPFLFLANPANMRGQSWRGFSLEMPDFKSKSHDASVRSTLNGQCAAIYGELDAANGAWVPLPQIMRHAAQYNARLHALRKLGHAIENKTEIRDGVRHSWYRLVGAKRSEVEAPRVLQSDGTGVLFAPDEMRAQSLALAYETGQRGAR